VRYGGFWIRAIAASLDSFFIVLLSLPMFLLGDEFQVLGQLIVGFLYETLLTSGEKQATWGKQLLGLKVTNLNGSRISYGKSVGRYFGKLLSTLTFFVGFLMAAFTDRKQALHDRLVDSLVLIPQGDSSLDQQNQCSQRGVLPEPTVQGIEHSEGGWVIAGFDESGHVRRFLFQMSDDRLSGDNGIRIGRSEVVNDFVISDSSVSRTHARFVKIGRELFLEDLGSKNGTFIGNIKLDTGSRQRIYGDQDLRFGDVTFSVGKD
jgi:hypothetical protein